MSTTTARVKNLKTWCTKGKQRIEVRAPKEEKQKRAGPQEKKTKRVTNPKSMSERRKRTKWTWKVPAPSGHRKETAFANEFKIWLTNGLSDITQPGNFRGRSSAFGSLTSKSMDFLWKHSTKRWNFLIKKPSFFCTRVDKIRYLRLQTSQPPANYAWIRGGSEFKIWYNSIKTPRGLNFPLRHHEN